MNVRFDLFKLGWMGYFLGYNIMGQEFVIYNYNVRALQLIVKKLLYTIKLFGQKESFSHLLIYILWF